MLMHPLALAKGSSVQAKADSIEGEAEWKVRIDQGKRSFSHVDGRFERGVM